MSAGTRKLKMRVRPQLPICPECPWKIWCKELNFRTMNPKGEPVKVCPIWWMVIGRLREKGIIKDRPKVPLNLPPVSAAEARILMDEARRKRRQGLGMVD